MDTNSVHSNSPVLEEEICKASIDYARKNAKTTYSFYNNELDIEAAFAAGYQAAIEREFKKLK